jgi:predicted dehydrogenase
MAGSPLLWFPAVGLLLWGGAPGSTAMAAASPYVVAASARGADQRPAPSNRVTLGCIGLGGRGTADLRTFLTDERVQVVALCDVDAGSNRYGGKQKGLAPAQKYVEKEGAAEAGSGRNQGVFATQDFREVLARDDVDAVCVATPDHWHAAIGVAAAKAGKDIYCEKPVSLTVADGRAMVEAVRRYGRVFQCGSQRRSEETVRHVCELVRSGRIGRVHTVRVGLPGGHRIQEGSRETNAPEPVPEGFDYDRWLGPAPGAPYTYNRCHWNFRWNLDYSGGQITDWGTHFIDVAHWGMGTERTGPVEVAGTGTFPPPGDLWNTATEYHVECTYASGIRMVITSEGGGVLFEGTEGSVHHGGGTKPPGLRDSQILPGEIHLYRSLSQHGNFIDCVLSRQDPSAPVEVAHHSIIPAHLGNIAMMLGRTLRWDPEKEQFPDDPEANRMLFRGYRAPWRV